MFAARRCADVPFADSSIEALCTNSSYPLFSSQDDYERRLYDACLAYPECAQNLQLAYGLQTFNRFHGIRSLFGADPYTDQQAFREMVCANSRESMQASFLVYNMERLVLNAKVRPLCPLNHEYIAARPTDYGNGNNIAVPALRGTGFCRCKAHLMCSGTHYRSSFISWIVGVAFAALVIALFYVLWINLAVRDALVTKIGADKGEMFDLVFSEGAAALI